MKLFGQSLLTFLADMIHLCSVVALLKRLLTSKSCLGISLQSQIIYLICYVCRYHNFFRRLTSRYHTLFRLIFMSTSAYTCYIMRFKKPICYTYDKNADCYPWRTYILLPSVVCTLLSMILHVSKMSTEEYTFWNIVEQLLIQFSSILEIGALWPQCKLLEKEQEVENMTGVVVVTMGLYRVLYFLDFMFSSDFSKLSPARTHFRVLLIWTWAIQLVMYTDLLYHYVKARAVGEHMVLPFSAKST